MGKTIRMRKEAIDFYQQNVKQCESNYSSTDNLMTEQPKEERKRRAFSDVQVVPKLLTQESNSKPETPILN